MIIIPDIHGRSFWKKAVEGQEDEKIIFLGDYTDPYPNEGIEYWKGLLSLRDVINFKKLHPNNVELLLGNHDLSYISHYLPKCRHDVENHDDIKTMIKDNLDLFDIVHEERVKNRRVVFSHAGILPQWLKENEIVFGQIKRGDEVKIINGMFHDGHIYIALGNVSWYRGGYFNAGSCVWADLDEFMDISPDSLYGYYQIFGHTQQSCPIITERFACLDCRKAFILDDNFNIIQAGSN